MPDWSHLAAALTDRLDLDHAPIGIAWSTDVPDGVPRYDGPMAPPAPDGRTGRVPAGCVFWMKAADRVFTTVAEDHGNCSVGSVTHGFKTWDDVGSNSDVAALFESGWVTPDVIPEIPIVTDRPAAITYGPLAELPVDPDVVLLRLSGKQAMVLHDAMPGLEVEGKPQCHILPMAKNDSTAALSFGCMLSRVRTGLPDGEVTCAIPATRVDEAVAGLDKMDGPNAMVAEYAADDAARF